jgi:hypothetical protein
MTTTEQRQQSLAAARRACEYLRGYYFHEQHAELVAALIAEFTRLDAGEQKRNAAGRKGGILGKEYGALGAEHGAKGGWPKGKKRKVKK